MTVSTEVHFEHFVPPLKGVPTCVGTCLIVQASGKTCPEGTFVQVFFSGVTMKLLKPKSCEGCIWYTKSRYFVPDRINNASKVLLLGQNPGMAEVKGQRLSGYTMSGGKQWPVVEEVQPQPLLGPTGLQVREQFWPLSRLDDHGETFESVSKANVIRCQVEHTTQLPPLEQVQTRQAALYCMDRHFQKPDKVKYVLAMGQLALWYTTRQKSVEDWRGYVLPYGLDHDSTMAKPKVVDFYFDQQDLRWHSGPLVMPVFHPAALFKGQFETESGGGSIGGNKRFFHATYRDFIKFGQLVRGEWPSALPFIKHNELPKVWPNYASFDTEFDVETKKVYMWSVADKEGNTYVVDDKRLVNKRVGSASQQGGLTLVAQNLLADVNHLQYLIDINKIYVIEDTMFAHSVLWTGEPHSLDYILSIYGEFNRHKHLGNVYQMDDIHDIDVLYAGLDAYTTLHHAWKGMLKEFRLDKKSWDIYRRYRLPLAYLIGQSEQKGIKVDRQRLEFVAKLFDDELTQLQERAKLLTNNDQFNLGSHYQVSQTMFMEEDNGV